MLTHNPPVQMDKSSISQMREESHMSKIERYPIFKATISAVNMDRVLNAIDHWIAVKSPHYMSICTAHTMLECHDDPRLAEVVNNAGIATPDGKPLSLIGRFRGYDVEQVCGPDLMPALCDHGQSRGYRHYFYGATDEVLEKMVANFKNQFPDLQIAGTYSPPFRALTEEEKQGVIDRINATNPDIVWCGLGTPKQDIWVSEHCGKLTASVLIPVGAAFNFHAGEIKRSPKWMTACHLEWLHRLCSEPRRLWRRYLIGNVRFIYLCLKEWNA